MALMWEVNPNVFPLCCMCAFMDLAEKKVGSSASGNRQRLLYTAKDHKFIVQRHTLTRCISNERPRSIYPTNRYNTTEQAHLVDLSVIEMVICSIYGNRSKRSDLTYVFTKTAPEDGSQSSELSTFKMIAILVIILHHQASTKRAQ